VTPANANNVFRALADPTRRAIFEELTRQSEQTVYALTLYAGVSQPAVSKHLTVLKRAKLVRHRRDGRELTIVRSPTRWRRWWIGSSSTAPSGAIVLINWKAY
jgi:DNA-binding transcriptional ArsR family regulator